MNRLTPRGLVRGMQPPTFRRHIFLSRKFRPTKNSSCLTGVTECVSRCTLNKAGEPSCLTEAEAEGASQSGLNTLTLCLRRYEFKSRPRSDCADSDFSWFTSIFPGTSIFFPICCLQPRPFPVKICPFYQRLRSYGFLMLKYEIRNKYPASPYSQIYKDFSELCWVVLSS